MSPPKAELRILRNGFFERYGRINKIIRGKRMKKKKVLKNASLVALSTVMLCGTAVAFAGCGGDSNLTLSVSIFCNDSDAATNEAICINWAKGYTQKLISEGTLEEGKEIKIDFTSNSNTDTYFDELQRQIASNNAPDVFYVSPKYVKVWKSLGRILDLTEYFEKRRKRRILFPTFGKIPSASTAIRTKRVIRRAKESRTTQRRAYLKLPRVKPRALRASQRLF